MKFPFIKEATKNLFSKPSTVQYPNKVTESPAKPNYRGRIAYDAEKCVNCGSCIKVCCPGAITKEIEETSEGKKITYSIDLTSCTFCGTCADFCNEGALRMTEDYHMVATDVKNLIVTGTRIQKNLGSLKKNDDCVYCTLCAKQCPQGAITVDRAEKLWAVDDSKCVKCGICISKCPKKALEFRASLTKNDDCVYCTLCAKQCPQGALKVDRAEKIWEVDEEKCVQCGICVGKCPKKALAIK